MSEQRYTGTHQLAEENYNLAKQLLLMRNERDKLQAENAELLNLLRRLQPTAPTRELFDAVTNAHLRSAERSGGCSDITSRINEEHSRHLNEKANIEHLHSLIDELKAERDKLQTENAELRAELQQWQTLDGKMSKKSLELQAENERLQRQLSELHGEIQIMREEHQQDLEILKGRNGE